MHRWQCGSLIFFGYLLVVAALPRGLSRAARLRVVAGAVGAAALIGASLRLPADGLADVWFIPPAILWIGYWTSGLLFVAPMPRAERVLAGIDQTLRIQGIAARLSAPVVELLEFAYTGVYPLIPIALYLALRQGVGADRFWTAVVFTDYVCFGMLPWVQTRPPRALGFDAPWRSRWRATGTPPAHRRADRRSLTNTRRTPRPHRPKPAAQERSRAAAAHGRHAARASGSAGRHAGGCPSPHDGHRDGEKAAPLPSHPERVIE